jgi:hypothetical protein
VSRIPRNIIFHELYVNPFMEKIQNKSLWFANKKIWTCLTEEDKLPS